MHSQTGNTPVLSIVIPNLNQSNFLRMNLAALAQVDDERIEVIVIDGGSTDNFSDVAKEFSSTIDVLVSEKDNGQSNAINKGFRLASGEWISFQNADDFYCVGGLRAAMKLLALDNADFDILFGGAVFVDEHAKPLIVHTAKWVPRHMMAFRNFMTNQSLFVRRACLQKFGGLDESLVLCLDFEWFLRLLTHGLRVKRVPYIIGAQRMHADTKTNRLAELHDAEFQRVIRRYFTLNQVIAAAPFYPAYLIFRRISRLCTPTSYKNFAERHEN